MRRRFPREVPSLLFFLCIGGSGSRIDADSVTLQSVADAELRANSPAGNVGALPTVVSGGLGVPAANETRRALMRFDLAGQIPSGSTVTSATVRVVVTMVPLSPVNSTFGLHRVLQSWAETSVTWTTPWSTPGAAGAGDSAATPSSSVAVSGVGAYTFDATPDLVADVQLWVDNPTANSGWLLKSDAESALRSARHFGARESVTNAPSLVVEFSPPQGAKPPELRGMTLAADKVNFEFTAEGGRSYTVEFTSSIWPGDWQTLTNLTVPASATNAFISDAVQGERRFYRVKTP
jgi:hypothetical protein